MEGPAFGPEASRRNWTDPTEDGARALDQAWGVANETLLEGCEEIYDEYDEDYLGTDAVSSSPSNINELKF